MLPRKNVGGRDRLYKPQSKEPLCTVNICVFPQTLLLLLSFSTHASSWMWCQCLCSMCCQCLSVSTSRSPLSVGGGLVVHLVILRAPLLYSRLCSSDSVQDEQMENCLPLFGYSVTFSISFSEYAK